MKTYDYELSVKNDIIDYFENNYTNDELLELFDNNNEFELYEIFYDEMFISDSVTGNASGSYTFSTYEAEENLCHNLHLLQEACECFCCEPKFYSAEWCDVTIRCYLLGALLTEVIDEIKNKLS